MNRAQVAGAQRAEKLIRLYKDTSLSAVDVAREMGWETKYPAHMLVKEIGRLRKRGYDIPHRQQFQTTGSKYR